MEKHNCYVCYNDIYLGEGIWGIIVSRYSDLNGFFNKREKMRKMYQISLLWSDCDLEIDIFQDPKKLRDFKLQRTDCLLIVSRMGSNGVDWIIISTFSTGEKSLCEPSEKSCYKSTATTTRKTNGSWLKSSRPHVLRPRLIQFRLINVQKSSRLHLCVSSGDRPSHISLILLIKSLAKV